MGTANRGGFTLIEALIIGLVIAILASISLPRWPAGGTRARLAEANRNMARMEADLASHRASTGQLPESATWTDGASPGQIPVPAPMELRLSDPFSRGGWLPIAYHVEGDRFLLVSTGPDGDTDFAPTPGWSREEWWRTPAASDLHYDPTNGTNSQGDVLLLSRGE